MASWRRLAVNRRLLVNLKSGEALAGVLLRARGELLELGDVLVYFPNPDGSSTTQPVDGTVLIERANVAFAQVLPAASGRIPVRPPAEEA